MIFGDPWENGPEYGSLANRLLRKFKRKGTSNKKVVLTTSGPVRDCLECNMAIEIGMAAARLGIPYDEAIERFGQISAHFCKDENGLCNFSE